MISVPMKLQTELAIMSYKMNDLNDHTLKLQLEIQEILQGQIRH